MVGLKLASIPSMDSAKRNAGKENPKEDKKKSGMTKRISREADIKNPGVRDTPSQQLGIGVFSSQQEAIWLF